MQRFAPKTRLTARTKSGQKLGRVSAVEIDQGSGRIAVFYVSAEGVIKGLLGQELAIAWNQVVDWQADELVVSDAAVPATAANVAYASPISPSANLSERA